VGLNKIALFRAAVLVLAGTLTAAGAEAIERPQRVASMNLCTDSMLFELARPEQIISVTALSRDPNVSYFANRSRTINVNRGLAEEVIALRPDLILAGAHTANGSNELLRHLGFRILTFEPALDLGTFRASFRRLASALGASVKAEHLLAEMDRRIELSRQRALTPRPTAIIYRPNGFSPGFRSLANDMLVAAGFQNLAEDFGIEHGGFVPLEKLVVAAPNFVLLDANPLDSPALADAILIHPALLKQRDPGHLRRIEIAEKYWTCGGTFIAEAIDRLSLLAAH
jgi:iron complex transport system substrate-binding protein